MWGAVNFRLEHLAPIALLVLACSRAQPPPPPDAAPPAASSASEAESLRRMVESLPPVPELHEEPSAPPPVPAAAKAALDAVESDELVHESFRLLAEGVSPTTVVAVLKKHLKAASKDAVGCALARLRGAFAAADDPSVAKQRSAVEVLERALAAEATDRGVSANCPAPR